MEPALDVIDRSLKGDNGARSFLERTSSIYVLDVTNAASPKTYGCWNFIHQALNEVERFESRSYQNGGSGSQSEGGVLTHHVRLLASMALRVARRSPASERAIVSTCIANAAEYHCSSSQSQWLIDLNLELREIVMGRIAAMALDFSFHRRIGQCAHSAFADKIVLDSFCAVLSANAVTTGPHAIKHFATEWIIPSSKNIPVPALVAVVRHLALEGQRLSAPVGTKDCLQELSMQIMSIVVVPTLSDAVSDNASQTDTTLSLHDENARISATALQALKAWSDATDLSLPQLRHICSKVKLDVLEVLSNAMYSDSRAVIDALAEFIEASCQGAGRGEAISEGRMNQVRHIIQVDESAFQANFTAEQLEMIETKEMGAVVEELAFAIGLQRVRFVSRQEQGDGDVCRNLARIASAVATSYVKTVVGGPSRHTERGLVEILLKVASHPHVNIASIAIQTIPLLFSPENSIVREALPVLQRRAIIPHEIVDDKMELKTESYADVSFEDFLDFREHVLSDTLVECWKTDGQGFFDSCTSAIEEFCTKDSSLSVSLFLEAAIFCIEGVGSTVMSSHHPCEQTEHLKRCTQALVSRPGSLLANPFTLSRMAGMIQKYSTWYREAEGLHTAADLVSMVFERSTDVAGYPAISQVAKGIDPLMESCRAMQELLSISPKFFVEDKKMSALFEMWKAAHAGGHEQCPIDSEARELLGSGLCQVVALLPKDDRLKGFEHLLSLPQDELGRQSQKLDETRDENSKNLCLRKVAGEIRLIAVLCRSFTNAATVNEGSMESGCPSSPDRRELVSPPVMTIVRRSWPKIVQLASTHSCDENMAGALCTLLTDLLPPSVKDDYGLGLLRDLGAIASSMIASGIASRDLFESFCGFLDEFIIAHGEAIDRGTSSMLQASHGFAAEREIFRLAEGLFLSAIEYARPTLGEDWSRPAEQGNGQPPFESRNALTPRLPESSKECLAALLPLLRTSLDLAPVFFSYLPSRPGVDREHDTLFRRAVDSTVGSLNETDSDLIVSAIGFLETMLKQQSSQQEEIRSIVAAELSRVSSDVLHRLLLGCCGQYELSVLDSVASYLHTLLRTVPTAEIEQHMQSGLRQEHFALGGEAAQVAMGVFARCARRYVGQDDLKLFLEDLWTMHRAEDRNALPQSDAVAQMIRRYRVA